MTTPENISAGRSTETRTPLERNVLLLVPHRPFQDPRVGWMHEGAPAGTKVHQLGIQFWQDAPDPPTRSQRGALVGSVPLGPYVPGEAVLWAARAGVRPGGAAAAAQLLWMERLLALDLPSYTTAVAAAPDVERQLIFRSLIQFFLDVTSTMLRGASSFANDVGIPDGKWDAIIASDLPAMPAALLLGGIAGVPVVYDAHEYWPEADLGSLAYESDFWRCMEQKLLPHAQLRVTVSPGLADLMQRESGAPFGVLPNAEPLDRAVAAHLAVTPGERSDPCVFLFQGGFARGRGIEALIDAWASVSAGAHLHLRGPDGFYKDQMAALARSAGLLDRTVFFPPAVREAEMIAAASVAQVGLVPYEPHGQNHMNCCPNKMSQYMAAGIPVLANRTSFVAETVERAGAGLVVDFSDRAALVAAVNLLAGDSALRASQAAKSREHFVSAFNWNVLSVGFYNDLEVLMASRAHAGGVTTSGFCENQAGAVGLGAKQPGTLYARFPNGRGLMYNTLRMAWLRIPPGARRQLAPLTIAARRMVRTVRR